MQRVPRLRQRLWRVQTVLGSHRDSPVISQGSATTSMEQREWIPLFKVFNA